MASFQLSAGLNAVNNPSADGIFRYGFWNWNDPNFPLGFNQFTHYGYASGATTPPGPPYDQNEVLGWFKPGSIEDHMAIAFEHLGLPSDPLHFQITPQPFPTGGIYVHPSRLNLPFSSGTKDPIIRIHILTNSNFSLSGTIQRVTIGCGSDIGYKVVKNQSINLIARTNLPTNASPTSVSISTIPLLAGDYVDIQIDSGDDGTDACDDTAVDFIVTLTPNQVNQPGIQGITDCESTSIVYGISLQQSGSVSLYKAGIGLIGTVAIVTSGINGTATFSGLDLSDGGTYYAIASNPGQTSSIQSESINISPCTPAAVALDDYFSGLPNTLINFNVSLNDSDCS